MSPKLFWVLTFGASGALSIVVGNRVPLAVWAVAALVVLMIRVLAAWRRRRRLEVVRRGFARLDAAEDIRAHGDADELIRASLAASEVACRRATAAIEHRVAPATAVEIAEVRTALERFQRTDDAADDLRRARALEGRARAFAQRSGHGLSRRTARQVGTVLGVWRSLGE